MSLYDLFLTAREFIHTIADVIREQVTAIVARNHFLTVMTDGSQARNTGNEKGLVLARTEQDSIPVYFVISILEMADFGGCDADSLKQAIDSVFSESGRIPLKDQCQLISATSDGANVNMRVYNGALTQMKHECPWLVLIHCVNHRLKLAIKDAVKSISKFEECDRFYTGMYYLFKNSGKLKTETKQA